MAQEVSQQDIVEQVQSALRSEIGNERLELWIPPTTSWCWNAPSLELSFANEFTSDLAQQMLGNQLAVALRGVAGEHAELKLMGSSDEAAVPTHSPDELDPADLFSSPTRAPLVDANSQKDQLPKQTQSISAGPAAENWRVVARKEAEQTTQRQLTQTVPLSDAPHRSELPGDGATESWAKYVPGDSNQVAWAAAKLVVAQPGKVTPLFLHGPSGSGKSLLVSGIAEQLRTVKRIPRVVHLTSEQFLNDFTEGLRGGGLPMFRRKYRQVETLILEDIQFFAGKKSSVTEVKHTLDNLLRLNKQVVFTSDRSLNDLQSLGNELLARIRGGLCAPIYPLDETTRYAILNRDLQALGVRIDDAVVHEISRRVTGDGRVLSGIAKRLLAVGAFQEVPLDWDRCWSAVGDLVQATQPIVRIGDIERVVCDVFGLDPDSLQSQTKIRKVSQPRMLAMFLARKYTPAAYKEIGHYFGRRRHSTVISAEKTVEGWLHENADLEVGRGLKVREAIRHVESQLQVG